LQLPPWTLGWSTLSSVQDSDCERRWRHALLDATARQATLAPYYSRLVDRSLREVSKSTSLMAPSSPRAVEPDTRTFRAP